MQITDALKQRIIRNSSIASDLNRFVEERVFGVADNGSIGVLSTGNGVVTPDTDARDLINGILSILGRQEAN